MFGRKNKKRKSGKDSTRAGRTAGAGGATPEASPGGDAGGASEGSADSAASSIGRYGIVRPIGQGAMGKVYLARDPVIGRHVAIKVINLSPDMSQEDVQQYRERFLREAQAAGALFHPNIVAVHDIGQDPQSGRPYIVMEYVHGRDLKSVIRERGPLPIAQAVRIVREIAAGLEFAHKRGIVHRDIKPANILLGDRDQVKITDFGVAHLPGSDLTQADQFVGSPGYMSPEQLKGGVVDGRSDLFALGVILYQLLTGHSPFEGESVSQVLYRISTQPADPPSELNPDLSSDFDPILERALQKDPDQRYQTLAEMIQALTTVAAPHVASEEAAARHPAAGEAAPGQTEAAPADAVAEDSSPHAPSRGRQPGRGPSPWLTLTSQWRLGALVAVLALTFVGINLAFRALLNGPLGRLAGAQEESGTAPGGAAGSLGAIGAVVPPAAAHAPTDPGTLEVMRAAGVRLPVVPVDRPIVSRCAMSYAAPEEVVRALVAAPRSAKPVKPASPPARLRLELLHRRSAGRLVVLLDGDTILSKPIEASSGSKKRSLEHHLSLPSGRHDLEVRLLGADGERPLKSRIVADLENDRIAVLQVEQTSGSKKGLKLKWGPAEPIAGKQAARQ